MKNQNRLKKKMWTENKKGSTVHLIKCKSPEEEAKVIVAKMKALHSSGRYQWGDMVVLYRIHSLSKTVGSEIQKAGLNHTIVGRYALTDRKVVKSLLHYIEVALDPQADQAFEKVINHPKRGIGKGSMLYIKRFQKKLKKATTEMSLLGTCAHLIKKNFPSISIGGEKKALNSSQKNGVKDFVKIVHSTASLCTQLKDPTVVLQEVMRLTGLSDNRSKETEEILQDLKSRIRSLEVEFKEKNNHTDTNKTGCVTFFETFFKWTSAMNAEQDTTEQGNRAKINNKISLTTIHQAKGLEWPVVFIMRFNEGTTPTPLRENRSENKSDADANEKKQKHLEEERRLIYVAMTRAKERLFFTYTETDTWSNKSNISVFAKDISAHLKTVEGSTILADTNNTPNTLQPKEITENSFQTARELLENQREKETVINKSPFFEALSPIPKSRFHATKTRIPNTFEFFPKTATGDNELETPNTISEKGCSIDSIQIPDFDFDFPPTPPPSNPTKRKKQFLHDDPFEPEQTPTQDQESSTLKRKREETINSSPPKKQKVTPVESTFTSDPSISKPSSTKQSTNNKETKETHKHKEVQQAPQNSSQENKPKRIAKRKNKTAKHKKDLLKGVK
eukprot:CAMPEP_0174258352 /NCGR_PEP_ID=MMETSP0439-20130205/7355_1 /TAXON_ID=0 /ORGANISM="Stereomyxa ramosa, Strain Chinc5" /LENGTH=619 /DNA_ID=CAMNT_0015341823 /DNA_START=118 /DNA_END=1978 /DNA_ORIENTATION=-